MAFQCWASAAGDSPALKRYWRNVSLAYPSKYDDYIPANTRHWNNVCFMLVHRLRRWPNIKPTLFQCPVFAGYATLMLGQRCRRWASNKTTLVQRLAPPRYIAHSIRYSSIFIHEKRQQKLMLFLRRDMIRITCNRILSPVTHYPSRHETLSQCCFNVGLRRWPNINTTMARRFASTGIGPCNNIFSTTISMCSN